MDHALAEQIRYYEVARRAAARRPDLHQATIGALDAHLALAGRASDVAQLSAALFHGGHATALARAGLLDRHAAELAQARALGDPLAARVARHALESFAREGDEAFVTGHEAFAEASAWGWPAAAGEQAAMLVIAAIDLACDPDPVRQDDHRRRARTSWMILRAFIPGFGLRWLTAPPVCHALPFAPGAAAALRELIAEALEHPADLDGVAPPPFPDAPPPAPVGAIATISLDGWPPAPALDPRTIVALMAAIDAGDDEAAGPRVATLAMLATHRDVARERDELALARFAEEVIPWITAANTSIEVAAWSTWHSAVTALERWWWHILVQIGLWPAAAALIDPSRARPAAVLAARLLGVDPRRALRSPTIARALRRQVFEGGQDLDEDRPTAGPGASLVTYLRVANSEHAAAAITRAAEAGTEIPDFVTAARRYASEASLLAAVDAALTAAGAPSGGDGAVVLWNTVIPLDAVDDAHATFARPRPDTLW